jgi:predicted O-methyltransferase YrrM
VFIPGVKNMQYENLTKYIEGIYPTYPIVSAEDYIASTDIREFCPVIDTSVAMFIKIFLGIKKPISVLELGTSIGYSTTIIASTIRDWNGRITTIDIDDKVSEVAMKNFVKYGLSDSVEMKTENAIGYLKKCRAEYDFIFLDLYKDIYPDVFEDCLRVLKSDGVLIADDTLFPVLKNDDETFKQVNVKLDQFNETVSNDGRLDSVILPFGDGVTLITKKKK